jgi:hypothetical protein
MRLGPYSVNQDVTVLERQRLTIASGREIYIKQKMTLRTSQGGEIRVEGGANATNLRLENNHSVGIKNMGEIIIKNGGAIRF